MAAWTPPPFAKLLGMNVLHHSPDRTEAELTVREELLNSNNVLHGGAVMALGDTLGGMTASMCVPDGGRTATIESKTNFFAGVAKGETVRAICTPLHRGAPRWCWRRASRGPTASSPPSSRRRNCSSIREMTVRRQRLTRRGQLPRRTARPHSDHRRLCT